MAGDWEDHINITHVVKENNMGRQGKQMFEPRTPSACAECSYQLFLQFYGPTTILLQTRASRLSDVLTTRDVNEFADTPPGSVQQAVTLATNQRQDGIPNSSETSTQTTDMPTRLSVASVGQGGKVSFEETDDFKTISR